MIKTQSEQNVEPSVATTYDMDKVELFTFKKHIMLKATFFICLSIHLYLVIFQGLGIERFKEEIYVRSYSIPKTIKLSDNYLINVRQYGIEL